MAVAATQELGSERWRFSDPRKPVDIFMAPGDLAEEEVHGPATAQPDGGADALGNLDRFGDQLKLTSEALWAHDRPGYAAGDDIRRSVKRILSTGRAPA